MSKKKTVGITVDPHLWDLAKNKLDISRSQFIENQIKLFLNIEDEETILMKEIEDFQNEINVRKDKICQIRDSKKLENNKNNNVEMAMKSLTRIHDIHSQVGLNNIEYSANNFGVSASDVEKLCKARGFKIVKMFDGGGVKNHDNKRIFV